MRLVWTLHLEHSSQPEPCGTRCAGRYEPAIVEFVTKYLSGFAEQAKGLVV